MLKLRRLFANLLANIILIGMKVLPMLRLDSKRSKQRTMQLEQLKIVVNMNRSKCSPVSEQEAIHLETEEVLQAWVEWRMFFRKCLAKVWPVLSNNNAPPLDRLKKEDTMQTLGLI